MQCTTNYLGRRKKNNRKAPGKVRLEVAENPFSLTPHFSGVPGGQRCWQNRFNGFRSPDEAIRAEPVADAGGSQRDKPLKRFRRRSGPDTPLKWSVNEMALVGQLDRNLV
jgi:hypothetical protein